MAAPTDQQYRHQLPPTPQHQYQQQQQPQSQLQSHRPQQQPLQQQSIQQFEQQLPADARLQYAQPSQHLQPQSPSQSQSKPRTFSFRSDKSRRSSGSKTEYRESAAYKDSRRLHTKADPSFAMNEAEPSAVAAIMSESSVAPLRSLDHRDSLGNPIAEPDKSNPTRSRWERPLDTIRSFEAAIDGGYTRKSLSRADTDSASQWDRRSSMMPGNQYRYPQDSYYASRPVSFRAESSHFGAMTPGTARNSMFDAQSLAGAYNGGGQGQGQGPLPNRNPRDRASRMQSEPHYQTYGREQNVYPLPHKDRSYETVTSAAASGNSDPAGYQTDPTSSDNSSIRRISPAKRAEPVNDYGIGFSQPPTYQPSNFSVGAPQGSGHPLPPPPPEAGYQSGRPQVPRKENAGVLRRQPSAQPRPDMPEKRKSWFSRRFSKNS